MTNAIGILSQQGPEKWQDRVHQELGINLQPKEGENWQQLYQRLQQKIFSSPLPLHQAVSLGCEKVIYQLVVQEGKDINELDDRGCQMTPLCYAVASKMKNSVEMLLRLNADTQPKAALLKPLEYALNSKDGDYEIAQLLLDKITELDGAIMCEAASKENRALLLLFLQRGFSINLQDERGYTALNHIAYTEDAIKIKMIQWLLDHGADVNIPNKEGLTPLHHAIWKKDFELMDLLLKHGADIFAVDRHGDGCIGWALFGESPQGVVDAQMAAYTYYLKMKLLFLGLRIAPYAIQAYPYVMGGYQKCLAIKKFFF
jgi:ankyrin repeat protein